MVTTYPSPPASGSDYTTVVTKSNGSVETDIVSHITTTDSNGKPTTIVTTVPSPTGSVDTTVVTNPTAAPRRTLSPTSPPPTPTASLPPW
ncbi:Hypothetical protein J6888_00433 [Nakaseomyces glabratus]